MQYGNLEPYFFGPPSRQLFGCYHAPALPRPMDCGIVLCHSLPHDYIRFHRSFRLLADHLAMAGFPVLRFDFSGCGDSSGDRTEGGILRWLDDIARAIIEIKEKAGVSKVCLLGLRLGGALAVMAGAGQTDVDGMVCWDPVVNGKEYIREIRRTHTRFVRSSHVRFPKRRNHPQLDEILGFPFPDSLQTDLGNLNLLSISRKPANRIFILGSRADTGHLQFHRHLQELSVAVEYRNFPTPSLWQWAESIVRVVVPQKIFQAIVNWVSQEYV